jgi:hypothetical protein
MNPGAQVREIGLSKRFRGRGGECANVIWIDAWPVEQQTTHGWLSAEAVEVAERAHVAKLKVTFRHGAVERAGAHVRPSAGIRVALKRPRPQLRWRSLRASNKEEAAGQEECFANWW